MARGLGSLQLGLGWRFGALGLYALAIRTQPDENLGSRLDYSASFLSQVLLNTTNAGEATNTPPQNRQKL